MIKKRYVMRAYVEEAHCDKCGAIMRHTGMVLTSSPAQYPFECTNPDCDGHSTFWEYEVPGPLRYEFEDEGAAPREKIICPRCWNAYLTPMVSTPDTDNYFCEECGKEFHVKI